MPLNFSGSNRYGFVLFFVLPICYFLYWEWGLRVYFENGKHELDGLLVYFSPNDSSIKVAMCYWISSSCLCCMKPTVLIAVSRFYGCC